MREKKACEKAMGQVGKVQALYHCSRRDDIMQQLEDKGYAFMQIVVDCRILGLTTFNSLLQYVNRLVWEVCSVI